MWRCAPPTWRFRVSTVVLRVGHSSISKVMRLRIARHTDRLDGPVVLFRNRVGLRQIGGFDDHGVFLEVPGTNAAFELTTGSRHRAPNPHPESLVVLHFDTKADHGASAPGNRSASRDPPPNPTSVRMPRCTRIPIASTCYLR
jgi:hypothetical protein